MSTEAQSKTASFYENAQTYWSEIPATIDGMLGGHGHVSQADVQGSRQFLKQILNSREPPDTKLALDCGAGIGRITKNLLTTIFDKVDLVEQNPAFLDQAKELLAEKSDRIGEYYPIGLQSFQPEEKKYDVIWAQWVLGHLTDAHFVKFLQSCKKGLKENGIVVIKENITSTGEVEVDEADSSVTRPYKLYIDLFDKAEMVLFKKMKQPHFPKELYAVYMYALRPKQENNKINDC